MSIDASTTSILAPPRPSLETTLTVMFAVLALIPGTASHYIYLGVAGCASLVLYAVARQTPGSQFALLEAGIAATEHILEVAKCNCARDHVELLASEGRLLQVKLSASNIQSQMLEARGESWKMYFQRARGTLRTVKRCAATLKEIQTSLLLTIEAERRRKLTKETKDLREVLVAVMHPLTNAIQTRAAEFQYGVGPEVYMSGIQNEVTSARRALKNSALGPVTPDLNLQTSVNELVWVNQPERANT
ncbi:hypothetical protein C8R46DRAFT_1038275 [Mycena filopes]|nr:hypothetical protein C8R46DRAFT_1038275 [Mycena filopes]